MVTVTSIPTPSLFTQYCSQVFGWIFQNPTLLSNPIGYMFIISAIPSVLLLGLPKTEFTIGLLANGADATGIIIASTAGNLVSEIILYYLARHGSKFLKRRIVRETPEIRNYLHKYSWLFFIVSPFIPIGTDALTIFAGLRHVKIYQIIPPMAIGFTLKNIILVYLIISGLWIFPLVGKICTG